MPSIHRWREIWNRSQVLRFFVVGVCNTAVSYSIYAGFVFIGFGYVVANLIAIVFGILFSYKSQGLLVFDSASDNLLGRFVIAWAVLYLINILVIGRFIAIGFNAYVGGALALPFITLLSYLAQKHFVFRR